MLDSCSRWTHAEEQVARTAFDQAYQRETKSLIEVVRERAGAIAELDDIWALHDFLSARRFDIDGKYDREQPGLLFSLAQLVKEGWLQLDDLQELDPNKRAKVSALANM
ncbi:hypothetical protein KR51_00020620 [Rubidibacter lacunae KORDI 51-2]|uniref:Fluorescence recovery protein (RFP) n=1 Tax=Rubidibacter lacunae KORDI 51-2 TaxID=582515 RepID=U5DP51_9CHRO|nr:hypothetical protein [Rubidibacter lacunae]ERN41485.1 hypothetical protein KR51_00020620 [Rubidibacter lacunae KORDI 51-2]